MRALSLDTARLKFTCKYGMVRGHLLPPCQVLTFHRHMPDAAHTLPTLFSFTTPAKYCYRAIATFCKFATGMLPPPSQMLSPLDAPLTSSPPNTPPASPLSSTFNIFSSPSGLAASGSSSLTVHGRERPGTSDGASSTSRRGSSKTRHGRRTVSALFHRRPSRVFSEQEKDNTQSSDVAGPRFGRDTSGSVESGVRHAGEPSVYDNGIVSYPWCTRGHFAEFC